jgi:polysaccharide pyruvyl transferase WcaK-like protein
LTARPFAGRRERSVPAPRVGLFGNLGSHNIGNDASMESVLRFLRADHPDAILDAMCGGPERVTGRYGIPAIPLTWYQKHERKSGATASALKALGKGIDAFRTAFWVRQHDVVIVPGAGVLEASLPLRAMGFPYALFVLCVTGRLFGTKVALVSVGAGVVNQRLTRSLFNSTVRLAFYRSYRDAASREVLMQRGLDVAQDPVYPDLVFGVPAPSYDAGDAQIVGVGVLDYYGRNDERRRAAEIRATYVGKLQTFVQWLVDNGRQVRLFVGDANGSDDSVVQEILADVRSYRPDLDPAWVMAEPTATFTELRRAMAPVGTVIATRYHNVLCALMLGKPTISLSYSDKNDSLMAEMGLSEFCQFVGSLDVARLIEQFGEVERRAAQLKPAIAECCEAKAEHVDRQFAALSALLFPANKPRAAAEHKPAGRGAR